LKLFRISYFGFRISDLHASHGGQRTVQTVLANVAASADSALGELSADARCWFLRHFDRPTAAQRRAWGVVAGGANLLLATPTGSGKTLAALLPIVDCIRNEMLGGLRCIYVAPLTALLQDACSTLERYSEELGPLDGLSVRVGLRIGDTPARVRRQQLDDPPHLLFTTPESLAVLLANARAGALFGALRWVVVDEVHALAGNKRGADLALSLERLEALADTPGGLQRVGLSATCAPLSLAADFLAGVGRPCRIAQVADTCPMDLRVEPLQFDAAPGFINRLVARLERELAVNRTTLIFTNTRNLTERVTWALRKKFPERSEDVAAHHSALAPARRRLVERAMKRGELWAVVSSTSLELGIDIGSVDGIVFVHPPGSTLRLLQRLGRSGHRPGITRRGLILTASARGLIEATVTAACARHGQIEALRVLDRPLDVLCQHLAGMAITRTWTIEDAYALVRRAFPYRNLHIDTVRACVEYLAGKNNDIVTWLPARLRCAGDSFTIADERTARLVRRNFGTIISEDPCRVRMPRAANADDAEKRTTAIGEVDEVYADRLQPGDRFMLDGRCLELRQREGKSLLVEEVLGRPEVPRWHGSGPPMSIDLASRICVFRVRAAESLRESRDALHTMLRGEYHLDPAATASVAHHIARQETISEVPDGRTLLIERLSNQSCVEYYFHTPLPCPANEAVARVVARRLSRTLHMHAVPMVADLGFLLVLEGSADVSPDQWRVLLCPEGFAEDFAASLGDCSLLRNRFGQIAQTGLLAPRYVDRGCTWAEEPLFERVRRDAPDFLLMRQAEREVADNACDLRTAIAFAGQVAHMQLRQRWLAESSPFADSLLASLESTS
jgi:ATP-dependent Lhr-like helicase